MDNKYIIVLDIGTTTAKSIVFSTKGKEIAVESIPYSFLDKPPGFYEQNPEEVYSAIKKSAAVAVKIANEKVSDFIPAAVSIVCQGGSLIPCDSFGNYTYPMITWMDSRANAIAKRFTESDTGAEIHKTTGFLPSSGLPLSMIVWLRENENDIFNKTQRWLSLNDYVIKKLTGNFITNYSSAGLTQLLNIKTKEWDDEMLRLAGIEKTQLSVLLESESNTGGLLKEAAEEMGIPEGIPVINGMHDRTAEAVGLGLYKEGESWIGTGTAWVVCSIINSERQNSSLTSNFHTITDKRIASVLIGGLGTSVEWWIGELIKKNGGTRKDILKSLDNLALNSPPGANGLIFKAFTGTGNEGSFINETDKHTDADRTRAVFESIAFDFKKEYVKFEKNSAVKGCLTLVGGAARSQVWPQIIAEILGVEIKVSTYDHDPALGGAVLAGKFLNLADTYEKVYEIFKTEGTSLLPEKENIALYKQLFEKRY